MFSATDEPYDMFVRIFRPFNSEFKWKPFPNKAFSSVQFSCSIVSDSLRTHGLQHTRPPCPSPNPRVYPNSCPLSWWYHPTISSSAVPFSTCPQSFPASGSFQMSQLFTSGGQRIGVSASMSVLPMYIQDWSPLGLTGLISLQPKGLSRVFSNTTVQKHQFFGAQPSLQSNSQIHTWLLEKPALTIQTFAIQVMSLLFNMLSLSTTQEKILHMDISRWSTPKSDWLYFLQPKWRSSIQSAKRRLGDDCGSVNEQLFANSDLNWRK